MCSRGDPPDAHGARDLLSAGGARKETGRQTSSPVAESPEVTSFAVGLFSMY